jgi:hypothetical protein
LAYLESNGIRKYVVAPRFTNLLQPADVMWFSLLKREFHKIWEQWFIEAEHTYTKHGNMKSPGYANCISWCARLWSEFNSNMLAESFDYCGITSRNHLHSTLENMLKENEILHDYIDDQHPSDEIDGFGVDDPTVFEKEISNQEANLIRMDNEIEAVESDDAEDSDFQTDSNSELEEEDDEVDDEEDNQEEENNIIN